MAEGEGFEPSLQVTPDYLVSNETPSTAWVTLRVFILPPLLLFINHNQKEKSEFTSVFLFTLVFFAELSFFEKKVQDVV